jgi:hypothetical protein
MFLARMASSALVVSIATVLAAACGGKGEAKQADGPLLTPYLAIGDSLAADTLDRLPELGTEIVTTAESLEQEPGVDAIVKGAGSIGAQDIQAARTAYAQMSSGMIQYLEAHPDEQAGLVIVHCPMTFGGKGGLWVQKQGKIMNPYEGARMLHCGDKLAWGAALPKT